MAGMGSVGKRADACGSAHAEQGGGFFRGQFDQAVEERDGSTGTVFGGGDVLQDGRRGREESLRVHGAE